MDTLCYGNTCITHSCGVHANKSIIIIYRDIETVT